MSFSYEIKKYRLYYYGKTRNNIYGIALIYLHGANDKPLGYVQFYRSGRPLPDNTSIETTNPKQAQLRMYDYQLPSVVDMLRNEKPCRVFYQNANLAFLSTDKEQIGEEDSPDLLITVRKSPKGKLSLKKKTR